MQQQQNKLILYLVIALGLVGGYFYYSQALAEPVIAPMPQASGNLDQFRNLRIDFGLLQKAEYKALRAYGESPVSPGISGKADPFAQ